MKKQFNLWFYLQGLSDSTETMFYDEFLRYHIMLKDKLEDNK